MNKFYIQVWQGKSHPLHPARKMKDIFVHLNCQGRIWNMDHLPYDVYSILFSIHIQIKYQILENGSCDTVSTSNHSLAQESEVLSIIWYRGTSKIAVFFYSCPAIFEEPQYLIIDRTSNSCTCDPTRLVSRLSLLSFT